MARIKLGAMITEMSGSIGGFTAQKNHYGTSLKVKNNPIRSLSPSQSLRRAELSSLLPIWQGLSDADRLQWNNYTTYNRQTAKNNSDSLLSGYNLFLKYNLLRKYAGLSVVTSPIYGLSNFVNTLPITVPAPKPPLTIGFSNAPNGILTSSSDTAFTIHNTSPFSTNGNCCAFNGSIWVGVGTGANTIAWSSDGVTWTGLGHSIFNTNGNFIIWDGLKFIATGQGTNTIAWSSNGLTWNGLGTSIFNVNAKGIAFNGTTYVIVGRGINSFAYSSNGTSWTGVATSSDFNYCFSVIWDGSRFVASSHGAKQVATSSNGITWAGIVASQTQNNLCIAWDGLTYVFGGAGSSIMSYTTDLTTWHDLNDSVFNYVCYAIVHNGTHFIAFGDTDNTCIAYSSNGSSWSYVTAPLTVYVAYGAGTYPNFLQLPALSSKNINFAQNIDITKMSCIVKTSQPLSRKDSILKQKVRIISPITTDNAGITWGTSFASTWGRNPIAGEWIKVELTFFSLVSNIVYKPVTQICQLT